MWMQNNYVRTFAGMAIAALFVLILFTEGGAADDSDTPPQHSPSKPTATYPAPPNSYAAPNPYQPLVQASGVQPYPQNPSARSFRPTPVPPVNRASSGGLPSGDWANDTPLGRVQMSIEGNKITINVDGAGEFAIFKPSLRGEFSVASDGTVYGLIHSVDLGIPAVAAQEMGEEMMLMSGLSDIPFSMRAYSEPGMLAIKQVTYGTPMQVLMATDGEVGELSVYVQTMLTGQYEQSR